MNQDTLPEIPRRLLKWFLALFLIHPAFYALTFGLSIGFAEMVSVFTIILMLVPPILIIFTIAFIVQNRKLGRITAAVAAGEKPDRDSLVRFLKKYPVYNALFLFSGCAGGPVLTVVIGTYLGVLVSWQQALFFFLLGEVTALVVGAIFYYMAKIELYPFSSIVPYTPLSLLFKFSVPILSTLVVLLTLASVALYKISVTAAIESEKKEIAALTNVTSFYIDGFFNSVLRELRAYSQERAFQTMNMAEMKPLLVRLEKVKTGDIEMLFAADRTGTAPTGLGSVPNIADRGYFKYVFRTGKPTFSEPVVSKATGKEIRVVALPVKRGGRVVGLMGATILMTTINEKLTEKNFAKTARFMVFTPEGKILYHPEKNYRKKIIGKDIVDNDESENTGVLMSAVPGNLFSFTLGGETLTAYKSVLKSTGNSLVFTMASSEYMKKPNIFMLEIIISITLLLSVIFIAIFMITQRISSPIKNTIAIFNRVSKGDLTVYSEDYIPDEFGEIIRHLKGLIKGLRGIAHITIESSQQLAMSSDNLSSTSQDLAQGAQTQAASVEEASASLEEISSSVESIADSAKKQSQFANNTNTSMMELKDVINQVLLFAGDALTMATSSNAEANRGNELMQKTIEEMNSIDESTKKIAEMVSIISDISDQVNLLALNAAIEAARAGDHGKGFAVVADEISKLAEETASGAKNIAGLVEQGLNEVTKGREYVLATAEALDNIIDNIKKTDNLVRKITESGETQAGASDAALANSRKVMEMADTISHATEEQMITNREMVTTINQINDNTQTVAANAEEIASSAEEISAQAEALQEQISFFKLK